MPQATDSILLIEDNSTERLIVKAALGSSCPIVEAESLAQAEELLSRQKFSLIILDAMLPDGDGFEFCKRLRSDKAFKDTPLIFLTSRSNIEDRVSGFSLGADDYVVKPLEPAEFAARVKSKLARSAKTSITHGSLHANFVTQKISMVNKDGTKEQLNLTPTESKLMFHFLRNEGHVFSRRELIEVVWGDRTHISDHTVDSHISSLRKKIGDSGNFLKAVLKKGYCFDSKDKFK